MGGVPCIRGLRVPVATVVGMAAERLPEAEILNAYPDLEPEDIREALEYAAAAVRERELPRSSGLRFLIDDLRETAVSSVKHTTICGPATGSQKRPWL